MSESFDPMIQLKTLLGDKPNHPWGALIPQVLLWCFRRFCIEKLTETSGELLFDQLWDDHFDLIHQHAPRGLESVSSSWFTPENIEFVHSSLEDYNRFFMEVLGVIDDAVRGSDPDAENKIAEFLDFEIKDIVKSWLSEDLKSFLIFPLEDKDDDEFSEDQFNQLLAALMAFMEANPAAPSEPIVPENTAAAEYPLVFFPPSVLPPPPPQEQPYLFAQFPGKIRERMKTRRARRERVSCGKTRRIH